MYFHRLLILMPLIGSAYCLRKSKYGCEGTVMHLECESGKYISPVRANFGRFEAGKCNAENNQAWSTRCIQPTTLRQVNSLCAGKATCSIDVTSQVFGDACPGTYKYLEVHYTCKKHVDTNAKESILPPWLLKMTATTSKPILDVVSTTENVISTTEKVAEPAIKSTVVIETIDNNDFLSIDPVLSVEAIEENMFNAINEELMDLSENMEDESIEEFLPQQNTLFLNFPLDVEPVTKKNVTEAKQNTILYACLISAICCTLVIFLAAVLYTKFRQSKSVAPDTPRKELVMSSKHDSNRYHEYKHQTNVNMYDYESSSSTNTTVSSIYTSIPDLSTVGSIYTTLPNGDKAIIIPMPSNQQYLRQILANPKLDAINQAHYQNYAFQQQQQQSVGQQEMMLQANTLQKLLQPGTFIPNENVYMDIEQPRL